MAIKKSERYKRATAKRRLEAAQSLPDDLLPLAGHLFMSSTTEVLALARDASQPLSERKVAVLILEAVQSGDWPSFSGLIDRIIAMTEQGGERAS
jgi:hypothetical protein